MAHWMPKPDFPIGWASKESGRVTSANTQSLKILIRHGYLSVSLLFNESQIFTQADKWIESMWCGAAA
jgi:hypothetical protein